MATRVLFLHNNGDWMRGSENALLTVIQGMDKRAFVAHLICGNPLLVSAAKEAGAVASLHCMPEIMVDGMHFRLQFLRWARTVRHLAYYTRRHKIDLIYCNGGSTAQVGYFAGKTADVPVVSHIHSPYNRRYVLLYRFHLVAKTIFVSEAIQKSICAKQAFRARCEVVYNGVDIDRFSPVQVRNPAWRKRFRISADTIVFGQVSSLISRKGIDVLLDAFQSVCARHANARLLLVGDGPERARFFAHASRLGIIDKVIFAGNHPDPLPFYQHVMDVNILASRSDAFPLSVLEAASSGLPTIGSAVDGIPESVLDNGTGMLFQSENAASLAEKMSTLLLDESLRRTLGLAARQTAIKRFSIHEYRSSIERIIREEATPLPRRAPHANQVPIVSEHAQK
jgi:glycosyltransferase involved in cell wall biosynthesis